jgi:hypothetical protein
MLKTTNDPFERQARGGFAASRVAASRAATASRKAWLGSLTFAVLGFLVGAGFWHVVGFWGFVSDVVLRLPPAEERLAFAPYVSAAGPDAGREIGAPPQQGPIIVTPPVLDRPLEGCANLVLDRTTGHTHLGVCNEPSEGRPADSAAEREDLTLVR